MACLRPFLGSRNGNISVMFALSLVGVLSFTGGAYDFSRVIQARSALQAAVDGAALAAGADPTKDSVRMHNLAQDFLKGNQPPPSVVALGGVTTSYDAVTKTVSARLTGEVPTVFMGLVGVNTISITVVSEAKRAEPGPLDLVLALDTTASMNQLSGGVKKIDVLKGAAANLIDNVMTSTAARVGIVPFSGPVCIGSKYATASWVIPLPDYVYNYNCANVSGGETVCTTNEYSCKIDGIPSICTQKNCTYSKDPVYACSSKIKQWNGCVGARKGFEASIASPQNPKYTYSTNSGPDDILDLTTSKTEAASKIRSLTVDGDTYIPMGLLWAWNMLTPEEPLTSARTKSEMADLGGKRVIVLMTDGLNATVPYYSPSTDNAMFNTITTAAAQTKVDDTLKQLCLNVKNDGITLYTVAFAVSDENIKTILRNCASDNGKYFDAADTALLNEAFTKIGASLQRLRITK